MLMFRGRGGRRRLNHNRGGNGRRRGRVGRAVADAGLPLAVGHVVVVLFGRGSP